MTSEDLSQISLKDTSRIDTIGQNGNDGLHYESES